MATTKPKSWINGKQNPAYREWYNKKNRKRLREKRKRWYAENKELQNARTKSHYARNKEKHRAWMRDWYQRNKETYLLHVKEYRRRNKSKIEARCKRWRDKNPDKVAQYCKNYRKRIGYKAFRERTNFLQQQRMKDPANRIRMRLSQRLIKALKLMKAGRFVSVMDLIGCTMEHFKQHIESLFQPGMSWDNIGKWQLDHKIPVVYFRPFNKENQKKAFHWSNYQPLWKRDNLRKTDKLPCGTSMRTIKKRLNGSQPTLSKVE